MILKLLHVWFHLRVIWVILCESQSSRKHLKIFSLFFFFLIVTRQSRLLYVYLNGSVTDCSYAFLSNPVPRMLPNCSTTKNGHTQKLVTCTEGKNYKLRNTATINVESCIRDIKVSRVKFYYNARFLSCIFLYNKNVQ